MLNYEYRFHSNYFFHHCCSVNTIKKRFEQLKTYTDNFGVLPYVDELQTIENSYFIIPVIINNSFSYKTLHRF